MTANSSKPWWREPLMWLVIGGPLVVVIAGIATAVIAMRGADTVLPHGQTQAQSSAELPAMQGRNHVAAPDKALK